MSLTFVFIILSIGIGYLLYDTFRRSRPGEQPTSSANSRLKVNYARQCKILNTLQREKKQLIKTRSISINLGAESEQTSEEHLQKIKENICVLTKTHNIYLLQHISETHGNLFACLKQTIGQERCIPYSSVDGAVALLRQLSCGIHLESNQNVYSKIKQYLNNIWFVGKDSEQKALREFNSPSEMLLSLQIITH